MPLPKSKTVRPLPGLASDQMVVKIVTLFLVFIAVLGMFGKLSILIPKKLRQTAKCDACGRHKIGKGPCPCGNG